MATKTNPTPEKETKGPMEEHKPLFEAARKVLLAGIGAIALAQDEIEDFVNRLIERGEIAEQDGRKLVREIMDRRKINVERAEGDAAKRVGEVLERMSVPTKADIEALSQKIAALSKKVDDLKKSQG